MIRRPPRSTPLSLHDALPIFISWSFGAAMLPWMARHSAEDRDGLARAYELGTKAMAARSEEHTSELQSRQYLVCRLLLEKKKPLALSPFTFLTQSQDPSTALL